MWVTRLCALLLPLGIWFIQTGPNSHEDDVRHAFNGLITLSFAVLGFIVIGFGLMFGGIGAVSPLHELSRNSAYLSLPVADQTWAIFGLRGYGFDSLREPIAAQLCLSFLPLAITSAMLVSSLISNRVRSAWLAVTAVITAGILFPIAGFWMWGGGWLAALGLNMNLGHGAVDINGIATMALVTAGAVLAWLVVIPHHTDTLLNEYPPTRSHLLGVCATVCIVVGSVAILLYDPLTGGTKGIALAAPVMNTLLAVVIATLFALTYTYLTTGHPNWVIIARAAFGAVVATAAGSMLLPAWTSAMLGLCVGVFVTLGPYVLNKAAGWQDSGGIITSALFPGILGMVATGLFANGSFGQGLHGIGAGNYLGIGNLGIVGLSGSAHSPGDAGQLTAQLVAVVALPGFAFLLFAPVAWLLRRQPSAQPYTAPSLQALAQQVAQYATDVSSTILATNNTSPAREEPVPVATPPPLAMLNPRLQSEEAGVAPVQAMASVTATAESKRTELKETLLQRLRRARGIPADQDRPAQARHVAYPKRVAGRRLSVRPLQPADNQNPVDNSTPAK
jgi:Amt family ammonium transporter